MTGSPSALARQRPRLWASSASLSPAQAPPVAPFSPASDPAAETDSTEAQLSAVQARPSAAVRSSARVLPEPAQAQRLPQPVVLRVPLPEAPAAPVPPALRAPARRAPIPASPG